MIDLVLRIEGVLMAVLGLMHLLWIPKCVFWPEPEWSSRDRWIECGVGVGITLACAFWLVLVAL